MAYKQEAYIHIIVSKQQLILSTTCESELVRFMPIMGSLVKLSVGLLSYATWAKRAFLGYSSYMGGVMYDHF